MARIKPLVMLCADFGFYVGGLPWEGKVTGAYSSLDVGVVLTSKTNDLCLPSMFVRTKTIQYSVSRWLTD